MGKYFSHDDVFPIIAAKIHQLFDGQTNEYVSHDAIVAALIQDRECLGIIRAAQKNDELDRDRQWFAAKMVAWFSQRYTIGSNSFVDQFDRTKISDKCAYRPTRPRHAGKT
jgi:hypothetical protein